MYKTYLPPSEFEHLYKICYKRSGISLETYNKLIEGGTVITTPVTDSLVLHKSIYSPDKVVQIISGIILDIILGIICGIIVYTRYYMIYQMLD